MRKTLIFCATFLAALTCNAQTNGSAEGHEYVDLGLSVKWATCNIGATTPEEYGDYFAWGETETKDDYAVRTYKWGGEYKNKKYCLYADYGDVDYKATLDPEDDAAHVKWGGNWRMPTRTEVRELLDNCKWKRIKQEGVRGYLVTSKINGNSIFIPFAGYRRNGATYSARQYGCYWTISLDDLRSNYAVEMTCSAIDAHMNPNDRTGGCTIRPVYSDIKW